MRTVDVVPENKDKSHDTDGLDDCDACAHECRPRECADEENHPNDHKAGDNVNEAAAPLIQSTPMTDPTPVEQPPDETMTSGDEMRRMLDPDSTDGAAQTSPNITHARESGRVTG